jgi:hypothetical protein
MHKNYIHMLINECVISLKCIIFWYVGSKSFDIQLLYLKILKHIHIIFFDQFLEVLEEFRTKKSSDLLHPHDGCVVFFERHA